MTNDDIPQPQGTLALQTIAMPENANWNGDIFGGWLVSQMDLAGAVTARARAKGRVATVAIDSMAFLRPVPVGAVVSCYTRMQDIGRSSMQILVEVWIVEERAVGEGHRGHFVRRHRRNGRTRSVPRD